MTTTRQISFFRGASKCEAWRLAKRAEGAIRFHWLLGMRWIHRVVMPDGTIEVRSAILIAGAKPPAGALPDIYDAYTRERLRELAKVGPDVDTYELIDELCTVRLCSQPDLDRLDALRRRAEQYIRDHQIPRDLIRQSLAEMAEALDAKRIDVWHAIRLGCPP